MALLSRDESSDSYSQKSSLVGLHICRLEKSNRRLLCGVNDIGKRYVDRPSKGFAAEHAQLRGVVPLHIESRESSLRAACYCMTPTTGLKIRSARGVSSA
jgi:hypothetical protein